mgnify:FL=1
MMIKPHFNVYKLLIGTVKQVEAKLNSRVDENDLEEEEEEEHGVLLSDKQRQRTKLSNLVRETLVHGTIYNKLSRAVAAWKPRLDENHRLDSWILPRLPHLTPATIPALVIECKRKLKNCSQYCRANDAIGSRFCG